MAAVGRSTMAAAAAIAAGEPAATVEAEASEEAAAEVAADRAVRPATTPDGAATDTKRPPGEPQIKDTWNHNFFPIILESKSFIL